VAGHALQKTVLAGAATLLWLESSFWHVVPFKVLFAVEDLVYYSWILAFCKGCFPVLAGPAPELAYASTLTFHEGKIDNIYPHNFTTYTLLHNYFPQVTRWLNRLWKTSLCGM
jgi:hypothetical protein